MKVRAKLNFKDADGLHRTGEVFETDAVDEALMEVLEEALPEEEPKKPAPAKKTRSRAKKAE